MFGDVILPFASQILIWATAKSLCSKNDPLFLKNLFLDIILYWICKTNILLWLSKKQFFALNLHFFSTYAKNISEQDWVAFMSLPYWVEVKVEVEMSLSWGGGWFERLSRSLIEMKLRLSELNQHWSKEEIGLSYD